MSIKIIALENCPYSIGAYNLLVPNKNNQHKQINVKWVNYDDKHKYKKENRQTFPQISFINEKEYFLGGYSELKDLINELRNQTEPCKATSLQYFEKIENEKDKSRALKIILEAVLDKSCK